MLIASLINGIKYNVIKKKNCANQKK
jgi:hypothetical protein